jgi:AraC family transcriptional regulator, regulatory protein of adaptative response / methylated-DNA-[protein]-cysteine methyltransferase
MRATAIRDTPLTDDERWQAVQRRDRNRDGQFVLAVRTTGIYCRPSCPARQPKRENVRFYLDADAAERAGFRPCKRCKPRAPLAPHEAMVARATAWLDEHLEERVTLGRLAAAVGVSPAHLQRTFTEVTGVSPRQYVAAKRLEGAKTRLRRGDEVGAAIFGAGYGSSSRFYAQARASLGMSPASYRRGGEGATIRYATAQTAFGPVLVAATERGVCAVSLGENEEGLEETLREEFPRATIERDVGAVRLHLAAVLAHLRDRSSLATVPLDVQATPFQGRVWAALRAIPPGERRTYGDVAAALGDPGAARAVASACASNPVAIVIPCHRVVRGDGGAGGYRWGFGRKEALLTAERGDRSSTTH